MSITYGWGWGWHLDWQAEYRPFSPNYPIFWSFRGIATAGWGRCSWCLWVTCCFSGLFRSFFPWGPTWRFLPIFWRFILWTGWGLHFGRWCVIRWITDAVCSFRGFLGWVWIDLRLVRWHGTFYVWVAVCSYWTRWIVISCLGAGTLWYIVGLIGWNWLVPKTG